MHLPLKLYGLDKNKLNNSWKIKGVFGCKFQYYTFVLEVTLLISHAIVYLENA